MSGGSIGRSVAANAATAQASAADLENARLTYQSQLAEIYFELHGLDGDADLLQRTLTLYEQSLQLTRDRFDAGIASGADVAQAKTQLASTLMERRPDVTAMERAVAAANEQIGIAKAAFFPILTHWRRPCSKAANGGRRPTCRRRRTTSRSRTTGRPC